MADQKTTSLSGADEVKFNQRRALIAQYLDEDSIKKFDTAAGKLGAIRAILDAGVFAPYRLEAIETLGIVLGDTYVQDMGFHWVNVSDDLGMDYAVQYNETSIIIFPIAMIDKRIPGQLPIDIFDLYNGVANEVENLISQGR